MIIRGSRANPLLFHRSINARAPYLGIVGRVLRGTAASNASCRVRAHTTLRLFAAAESIVDTPSIPKFSLGTPRSDTEYRDPTLLADHALALQVNHTWFLSRLDIYIYIYSCLAAITGAIVDNRRSKFPGKRKDLGTQLARVLLRNGNLEVPGDRGIDRKRDRRILRGDRQIDESL